MCHRGCPEPALCLNKFLKLKRKSFFHYRRPDSVDPQVLLAVLPQHKVARSGQVRKIDTLRLSDSAIEFLYSISSGYERVTPQFRQTGHVEDLHMWRSSKHPDKRQNRDPFRLQPTVLHKNSSASNFSPSQSATTQPTHRASQLLEKLIAEGPMLRISSWPLL